MRIDRRSPRERPDSFRFNENHELYGRIQYASLLGGDRSPGFVRDYSPHGNFGWLYNFVPPGRAWVYEPKLSRWMVSFASGADYVRTERTAVGERGDMTLAFWGQHTANSLRVVYIDKASYENADGVQVMMDGKLNIRGGGATIASSTSSGTILMTYPRHHGITIKGTTAFFFRDGLADGSGTVEVPARRTNKLMIGCYTAYNYDYIGTLCDVIQFAGAVPHVMPYLADPGNTDLRIGGVPLILPNKHIWSYSKSWSAITDSLSLDHTLADTASGVRGVLDGIAMGITEAVSGPALTNAMPSATFGHTRSSTYATLAEVLSSIALGTVDTLATTPKAGELASATLGRTHADTAASRITAQDESAIGATSFGISDTTWLRACNRATVGPKVLTAENGSTIDTHDAASLSQTNAITNSQTRTASQSVNLPETRGQTATPRAGKMEVFTLDSLYGELSDVRVGAVAQIAAGITAAVSDTAHLTSAPRASFARVAAVALTTRVDVLNSAALASRLSLSVFTRQVVEDALTIAANLGLLAAGGLMVYDEMDLGITHGEGSEGQLGMIADLALQILRAADAAAMLRYEVDAEQAAQFGESVQPTSIVRDAIAIAVVCAIAATRKVAIPTTIRLLLEALDQPSMTTETLTAPAITGETLRPCN